MINVEKEQIAAYNRTKYLLQRVGAGFASIFCNPVKAAIAALYVAAWVVIWALKDRFLVFSEFGALAPVLYGVCVFTIIFGVVAFTLVLLLIFGAPLGSGKAHDALISIGLLNNVGEAPYLLQKYKDKQCARVHVWVFDPRGIPLCRWEDRREEIQAALNVSIVDIAWGKNRHRIVLRTVPAKGALPDYIAWDDSYLPSENFKLALGESYVGPVHVDLAKTPHVLIGGSTGSGKSGLLKLLLMQAYHKGAELFIADFKGGVDFNELWHFKCWMCFDIDRLLEYLDWFAIELERRKELFRAAACSNIDQYNAESGNHVKRFIFACDEVAEVLDKTGLTKEQKDIISQIESKLGTIARQGRAFGLHLFLATQRPDATIIPGQIRNNMDFRVCGRADNVLSQIILDSTIAADQIPKDAQGRFVTGTGVVFQAYLPDEKEI